jgi:hypothetical protein
MVAMQSFLDLSLIAFLDLSLIVLSRKQVLRVSQSLSFTTDSVNCFSMI